MENTERATGQEIELLKNGIESVRNFKFRKKDKNGKPGGLIELPSNFKTIIVGELHASVKSIQAILSHEENAKKLLSGEQSMILLGDFMNSDQSGKLMDINTNITILDYILHMLKDFPGKVILIRGNHESFDDRVRKNNVPQCSELKKHLIKVKGKEYTDLVEDFFESLPVFLIGNGFILAHSGPIRGGATREELANILNNRDKVNQLLSNRLKDFKDTEKHFDYTKEDVEMTIEKLGLAVDTPFIVSHNPLWNTGNKAGIWLNILGITNHHILYSGTGSRSPYFIAESGTLTLKFSLSETQENYYYD